LAAGLQVVVVVGGDLGAPPAAVGGLQAPGLAETGGEEGVAGAQVERVFSGELDARGGDHARLAVGAVLDREAERGQRALVAERADARALARARDGQRDLRG